MPSATDAKRKDSDGHYPKWRNCIIKGTLESPKHLDDLVKSLFEILLKNEKNTGPKKEVLNRIYEYLERVEGFYYGVSEGFHNSSDNEKLLGTTEHAVPAKVLINIFQALVKNKKI